MPFHYLMLWWQLILVLVTPDKTTHHLLSFSTARHGTRIYTALFDDRRRWIGKKVLLGAINRNSRLTEHLAGVLYPHFKLRPFPGICHLWRGLAREMNGTSRWGMTSHFQHVGHDSYHHDCDGNHVQGNENQMAQTSRIKLRGCLWLKGQARNENEPCRPSRFFARDISVQVDAPVRRAVDDPNNTRPMRPGRPGDRQPWPAEPQRPPGLIRPGPPWLTAPPQGPPAVTPPSAPPSSQAPAESPASTANGPSPAPSAPNPSDGGARQSDGAGVSNPSTTQSRSGQQTSSTSDAHDKNNDHDDDDNKSTGALTTILSTMTDANGSIIVQTSVISQTPSSGSGSTSEQDSASSRGGLNQGQIAGIVVGVIGK